MTPYDNNMRGVLFKNKDKQGNGPDYKGHCEIDGKQFWMDAWIKTPKAGGDKFMSVSLKPKMAREHAGAPNNPPSRLNDEPF